MTNRELLEMAARAVGYDISHPMNAERAEMVPPVDALMVHKDGKLVTTGWNPLRDDADALRLAIELRMLVGIHVEDTWAQTYGQPDPEWKTFREMHEGNPRASTRRAIVRAAAEIGRSVVTQNA